MSVRPKWLPSPDLLKIDKDVIMRDVGGQGEGARIGCWPIIAGAAGLIIPEFRMPGEPANYSSTPTCLSGMECLAMPRVPQCHSRADAMRAPSPRACSFAQATVTGISLLPAVD